MKENQKLKNKERKKRREKGEKSIPPSSFKQKER